MQFDHSETPANKRKLDPSSSDSEEEEETAQEKRLRLTKQYLAQLEEEGMLRCCKWQQSLLTEIDLLIAQVLPLPSFYCHNICSKTNV